MTTYDQDRDGVPERMETDVDGDGDVDGIKYDADENGVYEREVADLGG